VTDSKPARSGPRQHPLYQLVIYRLREFVRQPEAVFWVYFFPILMVVALGIAFRNKPVESFSVDAIGSPDFVYEAALRADPRIKLLVANEAECRRRLRIGKSDLLISVVDGEVEYVLDPTRPNSLTARATVQDLIQRAAGREDIVGTRDVEVGEPGGRYVDFLIPGLLGMGLMGGGMFGVGFAIVDLRLRKLLRRFLATPMRRTDFLWGLMISRMVFMIPEILLLLIFARYAFGVVVYGSWLAVGFLIVLGALQFAGIGLLVGSRVRTLESASGLMNLVMLPMWVLSGVFFSYERFPAAVQPLIKWLPLTSLNDALRAVMLEGSPLTALFPEMLVMVVWTVVSFAVALLIFRWGD
jgi:ABC-type multidrug transport system permease subunit